ncbi:cupin-like domain-containing protein [Lentzea sp. NBC_00516]|uniref:cupin-like domain-containing protein n=1 Tax=Lentzea sp. NBC_00516 TaxID=2903582 RepID=UPI002E800F94|nr:cupin-like domain-containing protein [Lentzea sp. NBC_00516]WUD27443.1 cupin-like domain-containing protein [Lentzea sp. NBC_00516]
MLSTEEKRVAVVPDAFWERVLEQTGGGTTPAIIDLTGLDHPVLTAEDLLEVAGGILRAGDVAVNGDGVQLTDPVLPDWQPTTIDEFERFVRALGEANGAEAITFTRDYCLKYSTEVAMKVRAFISAYVSRMGLPTPGVNAVFIAGRYRETWIGLHNDFCRTFLIPVHGRKQIMLWEPSYFENMVLDKKPALNGVCFGHIDVDQYAADAVTLTVGPGQMLFIPEKWWHYNKFSELESTLGLSVGVFSNGTPGGAVSSAVNAALTLPALTGEIDSAQRRPAGVVTLGEVDLSNQLTAALDAVRDTMKVQSLAWSTANGVIGGGGAFRPAVDITDSLRLRGRADAPVILLDVEDGTGLLFVLGRMEKVTLTPGVRELVEQLAGLEDFVAPSEARELASSLYVRGAVEIAV